MFLLLLRYSEVIEKCLFTLITIIDGEKITTRTYGRSICLRYAPNTLMPSSIYVFLPVFPLLSLLLAIF